jgi:DNA-binding NtrC family response regulator
MARILVIGDDEDLAELFGRWLTGQGHDVEVVHGWSQRSSLGDRGTFDLVVFDCQETDQWAAVPVASIAAEPHLGHVRMVVSVNELVQWHASGARHDGHIVRLEKPYPLRRLSAVVNQLLE